MILDRKTSGSSAFKRFGLWMLALLCITLIYLSVRMMFADINAHQATLFLNDWSRRGNVPSDKAWEIAEGAAKRSVAFFPVNSGEYQDRLGRIYEWQDQHAFPGSPEATVTRRQALEAYQQATLARPNGPYSWARIAAMKMKLLEFDDDFDRAFSKAQQYGPWRKRVNYVLSEVGLTSWRELTPDQQKLVRTSISNLQALDSTQADALYAYAEKLRILEAVVGER